MLLKGQANVSPQRGMPVELTTISKKIQAITGETVQLYYINGSVVTIDAGQAIGVPVIAKIANTGILDAIGYKLGDKNNTSLSFTSTALTTEVLAPEGVFESNDGKTTLETLKAITEGLANGEYMVDYRSGTIYGKKSSVTVTLTATAYKVNSLLITATV